MFVQCIQAWLEAQRDLTTGKWNQGRLEQIAVLCCQRSKREPECNSEIQLEGCPARHKTTHALAMYATHPPVDTMLLLLPLDSSAMAKSGFSLPAPPVPAAGCGAGAGAACSSLRFVGAGAEAGMVGREEVDTAGWLAVAMMVVRGDSATGWSTPAAVW